MSKTVAIRVPDHVYAALLDLCKSTGQTMTELVAPHIIKLAQLPPAPANEIEVRLLALETQVAEIMAKLTGLPIDHKAYETNSEFDRYAVPVLKAYPSGGYYFRMEDLRQPELKPIIQKQAKLLGFKSDSIKIAGKPIRVWLNREYFLQIAH
jgi:hypothetical protein